MSPYLINHLPPRPPTPPRESNHDSMLDLPLKQTLVRPPLDPRLSLQTPPSVYSPKSATTNSTSTSSSKGSGKNVAFCLRTEYADVENENRPSPPSGPLVPSAKACKPRKGILKPFLSPNPLDNSFNNVNGATTPGGLITMLDSSMKQLAGADRTDRMDAYATLSRALRASNNLPDRVALQDRMPRFTEFIQRDITSSPLDSSLAIHALTFLTTILHFPGIASALTNEFASFLIDHCIKSFSDPTVPKDVMRHLLQVVAQQDFPLRVMTSDRVGRLVASLNNIEQHVTGKSIIHTRILIYKRLLKQCKPHMIAHNGWLRDVINDCLSSTKDIRGAAIVLGFDAGYSLGKDRQISRKLAEIFTTVADDQKYIDFYMGRLRAILKNKNDSFVVPRVWSIVLLLLRGIALEKWASLNPWLRLIQACFNVSDLQTRQEANYAWNRFVYVMHFDEHAFAGLLEKTFRQPVCSQWRRKPSSTKMDEGWRSVLFGSACNLFYYAFKPGSSQILLDQSWDHALKPIVQQLCRTHLAGTSDQRMGHAIAILTNLFDSTTRRHWTEDRVAINALAEPSELPAIDPKWLRRNASRVFDLLEPILFNNLAELSDPKSATSNMWQTLITSVASAASKEIKVSFDTTEFVSRMFTMLVRLGQSLEKRQPKKHEIVGEDEKDEEKDETDDEKEQARIDRLQPVFLASIRELVVTAITALGVLPFTEKQLCGRQGTFTPAATPSSRSNKQQGLVKSPVHHLFTIFASLPAAIPDDDKYYEFLQAVFSPFFKAKSPRAASEFAQEMLASVPSESTCPYGTWYMVATIVLPGLAGASRDGHSQNSSASDAPVAREYRDIAKLLERGLKSSPNLTWERWVAVLDAFESTVSDETGDAGRALAVVEPIAKVALDMMTPEPTWGDDMTKIVRVATMLLNLSTQPRDRQVMDAARRRLWGTPGSKAATFDPFDNIYKLGNLTLKYLYENLEKMDIEDLSVPFLHAVSGFLSRCNASLVIRTIAILQDGLALWVNDAEGRLSIRQLAATTEATKLVWDRICDLLKAQEAPDKMQLDSIEHLLCAAFQSRHRHVVNTATIMWNRVFDNVDNIRYPEELEATLVSIRELVDIALPGIDESSGESGAQAQAQRSAFIDSQDDMDVLNVSPIRSSFRDHVRLVPSGSGISTSTSPAPTPAAMSDGPQPSVRSAKRRTKLRHEDSQIQFEPIESSPTRKQLESQVLTERQKEVRERQREEGVLYDMRTSSPAPLTEVPVAQAKDAGEDNRVAEVEPAIESPALPKALDETPKKSTPKAQRDYEDFISSTPTPRRGQALPLDNDVEMSDPPSSPPDVPEVRRYPLADEIRSRSNSKNDIPWEFSSSPVSGSPLPQHRVIVQEQEQEAADADGDTAMLQDLDDSRIQESVVEDSFPVSMVPSSAPLADGPTKASAVDESVSSSRDGSEQLPELVTPSQLPAPSKRLQETPRSEREEFVDALSSPEKSTPSRRRGTKTTRSSQTNETSYAVSTGAERSMMRVADEAVAQRRDVTVPSSQLTPTTRSKSKKRKKEAAAVLDCITVKTSDIEDEEDDGDNVIPATPDERAATEARSRRSGGGRRKRKRGSTKCYDSRTKKRRSIFDAEDDSQSSMLSTGSGSMSSQSSPNLTEGPRYTKKGTEEEIPSSVRSKRAKEPKGAKEALDSEEEAQSQLISEHIAASQSQSRASPEIVDEPAQSPPQPQDVETAMQQQAEAAQTGIKSNSTAPTGKSKKQPADRVQSHMRKALNKLRGAAITRDEMNKIEDLLIDFKRELYDAERRGRETMN